MEWMKHEHEEIFAALRAEMNLELDDDMAAYITQEPNAFVAIGSESARGRAFAAGIARTHGLEGVRSLYRCLKDPEGVPFEPIGSKLLELIAEHLAHPKAERSADAAFRKQLIGQSKSFRLGAIIFCEQSGVV